MACGSLHQLSVLPNILMLAWLFTDKTNLNNMAVVFPAHVLNNGLFDTSITIVQVLTEFWVTNFSTVEKIKDLFVYVQ